jgi:hypothetical protein
MTPAIARWGETNHRPLHLQFSINCTFIEPQHTIVTKKILPRFKYGKSKVEEYKLTLTTNLGNLWVVNSIRHLGANGLADLLQQCVGAIMESTFGSKPLGGSCKKRYCQKP